MRTSKKIAIIVFSVFILCSLNLSQSLPFSKPEDAGMSSTRLNRLGSIIEQAIRKKDFPGAVIVVARKGKIVFRKAYGESQWIPERQPMDISMIFDISSLTKPVATATSVMILMEQGKIRLQDKVKDYIHGFRPFFHENGKEAGDVRIWHLLTHTSGLPPIADVKEIVQEYGYPCPLKSLVNYIGQIKKTDPPGKAFHYSCLGYITLGYIVQKISDLTIAEFAERNIFQPLNMKQTLFTPPEKIHHLCVPTEVVDGEPLRGVVHDPRARLIRGISGNSGLFSTADDLATFAQMMLNKGELYGMRILSPLSVKRMTSIYPRAKFSGRGLGWDLSSSYSSNKGDLFGPHSFGHTGYTGTSIWIDPDTQTFVILLTNRVHPYDKGKIVPLRGKVANIVASSIIKD